jgi:hypothetical protein
MLNNHIFDILKILYKTIVFTVKVEVFLHCTTHTLYSTYDSYFCPNWSIGLNALKVMMSRYFEATNNCTTLSTMNSFNVTGCTALDQLNPGIMSSNPN